MAQQLNKKIAILLLSLFVCINTNATATAQDSLAAKLEEDIRQYFNGNEDEKFYSAINEFKQLKLDNNDIHSFYIAWKNEIYYEINHNRFYRAMKKTLEMSKDLRRRKCEDEYYTSSQLLGTIYSIDGNKSLSEKYLKMAIKEVGQKKPTEKMFILIELANLQMDEHPKEAIETIDNAIALAKKDLIKNKYVYSDAVGFKTIIAFTMHDWNMVNECYNLYMKLQKENGNDFSVTYYSYVMLSKYSADGKYDMALKWADKLTNIDRSHFRTAIFEAKGDLKSALKEYKQYVLTKDSLSNHNMLHELNEAVNDMEMSTIKSQAEASKSANIILALTIFIAVVIIVTLVIMVRSRNNFLKKIRFKNKQLETTREKAMEADAMKINIMRNMTHEIRTPLNIISGFSQILSSQDWTMSQEEKDDIIKRVSTSTEQIVSTINNLLDISEREGLQYDKNEDLLSLNSTCRSAIRKVKDNMSEDAVIRLKTNINDSFKIKTDESGLRKILMITLSYAAKFSTNEKINMECNYVTQKKRVEVYITDTSNSIPKSESEKIFELFYKMDNNKQGLGVELHLARCIAKQLDCELYFDTEYSHGSRFVLSIPVTA